MPEKALVTGATGFIGSHLVEELVERNWSVTCLARKTSRTGFLEQLPVHILRGEAENRESLENAVKDQEYVFHLAAQIRASKKQSFERANHLLTKNLLDACLRKNRALKRFLYISSISAAGPSAPGRWGTEEDPSSPVSAYGRTKLLGEIEVRRLWDRLPATIIRPPNVYGPRQQETELLIKLIKARIVPLFKKRAGITSLIYVKDLVRGILECGLSHNTQNRVYYLTDGKSYDWGQILLTIKDQILGNRLFLPLPEALIASAAWVTDFLKKAGLIQSPFGRRAWTSMVETPWLFSAARAKKDFGFVCHYSLDEGFEQTIHGFSAGKPRTDRPHE